MFRALFFVSLIGVCLAHRQKRFIFNPGGQQPNSPFAGGGGGMSSPYGGNSGGMSGGYTPCTPSQSLCSLQCDNGYVKGPMGCDFCLCNANSQTVTVTTIGPVLVDPVDSKVSTTSPQINNLSIRTQAPLPKITQTTSPVDCQAARLRCSTSCGDKGYLVDPSDCTFCLCKDFMV